MKRLSIQVSLVTEHASLLTIFILGLLASLLPGAVFSQDCNISVFSAEAAKLDLSKIESVSKLANMFEGNAKTATTDCADKLFVEFRKFYYKARAQYEKHNDFNNSYPMAPKREKELKEILRRAGWDLRETEGSYYVGESGAWIIDRFRPVLTKRMLQYLQQRKIEISEGFSEDAMLLITWDKLRGRITFWEEFSRQNQNFPLQEEINFYLEAYFRVFLTGMDNSSIQKDYDDSFLRSDVKTAYEDFLRQNKSSRYYTIVKGHYEILERNKFRVTTELDVFLDKQGVKSMKAVQPPLY
jgi:hypothetical protein